MTIRKKPVLPLAIAFVAFILLCSAQRAFADADYDNAVNASPLTLNTKDTVIFVWDSELEDFTAAYRKFTPSETGLYELYVYNSYGTPNADDIAANFYPTPDDAYLVQNMVSCDYYEYLVSEAADFRVANLEKGKPYWIRISCWSDNSSFDTYQVKVSKHDHVWRQIDYEKGSFEDTGYGEWKCTRCDAERSELYRMMSSVSLSYKEVTYNGKLCKPVVKVKDPDGNTIAVSNYTVSYSNNKNVGKATVTIKGRGNYTGTKKLTFKINPKGTILKTPKAAKKAIVVKWKKQPTKMAKSRIAGYQIQLATNSKFTKNKRTVTVKGYKKVLKKVTKLKAKKKYYIRIRTYKVVNGKKYYSVWSKPKTVTTKK